MIYWLCQNNDTDYQWADCLPLGLENSTTNFLGPSEGIKWDRAYEHKKTLRKIQRSIITPTKNIYANFGIGTHKSRRKVADICNGINSISCRFTDTSYSDKTYNYESYINELADHRMVVCPRGNGLDCHRMWETLYVNRIPIIEKNKISDFFDCMPVLILDDWIQLNDEHFIEMKYQEILQKRLSANMKYSQMNYWVSKISKISAWIENRFLTSRTDIIRLIDAK